MTDADRRPPSAPPSKARIAGATLLAIVVAGTVLVVAVLPAEYGIDPLGTGRLMGLTDLAGSGVIAPQDEPYKTDSIQFVLAPFESLEYKYRIEVGGSLIYAWRATGEVVYDFHAEPDGAPEGFAESFDQQRAADRRGTYTAPFSGIHGWFWENRTPQTVTLTLSTAGFYSGAQEFRDGLVFSRDVTNID